MVSKKGIPERFPPNAVRICIDNYRNYDIQGRIYSKFRKDSLVFCGVGEMFLKVDDMFDENGFPQTFQERRYFDENRKEKRRAVPVVFENDDMILRQKGGMKTYDIVINSRRKSNWQGIIRKENGIEDVLFRSEMELLNFIWDDISKK